MRNLITFFAALAILLLAKNAHSQWYFPDEGKASIYIKTAYYPFENSWEYVTPEYLIGAIGWESIVGNYKPCIAVEAGLEFSRPNWGLQFNFGIKEEEIYVLNTSHKYKFASNYFTTSLLYFPIKQDQKLVPYIVVKAGIIFHSKHVEDNSRILGYGAGLRYYIGERFGCDLGFDYQSINYKRIDFGDGIRRHFNVKPVRMSLGVFYDI